MVAVFGAGLPSVVLGQAHNIASSAPGLLEAGVPQFTIRSQGELGLNSPPTDFRVLPDGRILVYAPGQLSLGDGTRWEVFHRTASSPQTFGTAVAVDHDGAIYTNVTDGFGKVEFLENGRWQVNIVAPWQPEERASMPVLYSVLQDGPHWYWHGESGPLVGWRPGETARVLGRADTVEHAFELNGESYLSDRTSGQLFKLTPAGMQPVVFRPEISVHETITSSAPFGPGRLLVGTYAHGLWIFDGSTAEPFVRSWLLGADVRINAICQVEGGYYAAAVENFGIVFFDAQGRVVQVLDKEVDHRLSHVRRLEATKGGTVLGLLAEGLLSVEFPARVSNFEPFIGSGVAVAHPYRFEGRLWMLVDGTVRRANYDLSGRLTGLAMNTPPGCFAFALSIAGGRLIVGTNHGSFYRAPEGWVPFAPNQVNMRILDAKPTDGRWLYGAQGEVGWLKPVDGGFEITPTAAPGLENLYNAETDSDGSIWIELGNGRLGRLQHDSEKLSLELFSQRDGIPEGWAQLFRIDGHVRFNFNQQVLRFDSGLKRFMQDEQLLQRYPILRSVYGRPARDSKDRLWATVDGSMHVFEETAGTWKDIHEKMPSGLQPYFLCMEDGGVVWMHREFRLSRYDPAMPAAPSVPLRTLVTRMELPLSGRNWFGNGGNIPALPANDNSLVVHFVAPGSQFAGPVTFEVKLEGADDQWVDVGSGGSAGFNRLKPGSYVLHVRPRTPEAVGQDAVISFDVQPPWFLTRAAYVVYGLSVVGVFLAVAWLSSYLQRRENVQLERLVAQRTRELVASNRKLESQVEEIMRLSQAVEQSPHGVALTTPEGTIVFTNPQFSAIYGYDRSELIGKSLRQLYGEPENTEHEKEIADALAAGRIWRGQITNRTKSGRAIRIRAALAAIRSPDGRVKNHLVLQEDITEWLAEQERRRRLEQQLLQAQKLDALGTLAGGIAHDFNNILTGILGFGQIGRELAGQNFELQDCLTEIMKAGTRAKHLVARILTFTRQNNPQQDPVDVAAVVMEAVKLLRASIPATIEVVPVIHRGVIRADATQIQQVVVNLGTNAVHAIGDRPGRIEIAVEAMHVDEALATEVGDIVPGEWIRLTVSDDGRGMDEATINRIFEPFFTTKKPGEGTGLGLPIVRAIVNSHHGTIRVRSTPGVGTTFEVYFPKTDETPFSAAENAEMPKGDQRRIMVVDDEESVSKFAAYYLEKLGYRATVFNDPRQALAAIEGDPERFDAIVTDLTMPHMTGAELLDRVRRVGRLIPAVIVSGYSEDLMPLRSGTVSHCAILQKPFSGEDLGRALEQVLRQNGA
jgi:PAS domain S-box-containing protein